MGHGRSGKCALISLSLLGTAALCSHSAAAAEMLKSPPLSPPTNEFVRAFVNDAALTVHFRSYLLDRHTPTPPGPGAWAGGGWVGYQSGWLGDFLRVGLVGYTSQPIWAPLDRDGTLLLAPLQEPYSVLGQAYLALKFKEQTFTAFRQLVDQPEVNLQDSRMTPNTFEGYTFAGGAGPIKYFAGYLDKMKTRNYDTFRDFAAVAGAPGAAMGVSSPMWLGTLQADPLPEFTARVSSYHVPNILTSSYTDFVWRPTFTELIKARFGGQFMYQQSTGEQLLTGSAFDTWSAGLRSEIIVGPVTFTVAYNQTDTGAAYRSPYGTWAGYNTHIVRDFNRAGETALMGGITYDFGGVLPGLTFTTNAITGRNAINPTTLAPLVDTNEYDFTLDYRFTSTRWPAELRPLWLRGRVGHVVDDLNGVRSITNDYRIIVNYEWVFKAPPP